MPCGVMLNFYFNRKLGQNLFAIRVPLNSEIRHLWLRRADNLLFYGFFEKSARKIPPPMQIFRIFASALFALSPDGASGAQGTNEFTHDVA